MAYIMSLTSSGVNTIRGKFDFITRCYDPECKNYKSEDEEIPMHLNPFDEFNEIDDDSLAGLVYDEFADLPDDVLLDAVMNDKVHNWDDTIN